MLQCMSCRCVKPDDCFKTEDRVYKSCQKCRNYQKDNRAHIASRLDPTKKKERIKRYYESKKAQKVEPLRAHP
jgi:hypothetical protein